MQFEWDPKKAKKHHERKRKEIDQMRPEYDFDYAKALRAMHCRRLLKECQEKK